MAGDGASPRGGPADDGWWCASGYAWAGTSGAWPATRSAAVGRLPVRATRSARRRADRRVQRCRTRGAAGQTDGGLSTWPARATPMAISADPDHSLRPGSAALPADPTLAMPSGAYGSGTSSAPARPPLRYLERHSMARFSGATGDSGRSPPDALLARAGARAISSTRRDPGLISGSRASSRPGGGPGRPDRPDFAS